MQALIEFDKSLLMVEELLKLEQTFSDPPTPSEVKIVEGLRGGVAVLVVACFEAFLKAVIIEGLSRLENIHAQIDYTRLPEKIQTNNFYFSLERATKGMPYEAKRERISRINDIHTACQKIVDRRIDPNAFTDTHGNPNANTVKELFSSMGIGDLFKEIRVPFETEWGNPEHDDYVRDKLNEVVNRRNEVAHTANILGITRTDLEASVKFLRTVARVLHHRVDDHIQTTIRACT